MDSTVIRVREARELLAYVPFRLGFRPRESLVAMSMRGRQVGLVIRVDITDLAHPSHGRAVARGLAAHLRDDGARRVILVLYTEVDRGAVRDGRSAGALAVDRLCAAIPGSVPTETWVVSETGYAALGCTDEGCCPPGGRPLVDLESTQVSAHMVLSGATVVPERGDLGVRARASERDRRRAATAAAAERRRREDVGGSRPALAAWADRAIRTWADLWAEAGAGRALAPAALGRVLVALEDVHVRDALIMSLAPDGSADESARRSSEAAREAFGPDGDPPDPEVVAQARVILEAVVHHAPVGRGAPALAVLAWLAWWSGDGARASVLVEQCLAVDPGHRLGGLLGQMLERAIPPAWVRREAGPGRARAVAG